MRDFNPLSPLASGQQQPAARRRFTRRALRLLVIAAALVICALGLLEILIHTIRLPEDLHVPVAGSPRILDRSGRVLAELPSDHARYQIPGALAEMGPWLPAITVALEDHRFYAHHGVDWQGLASAAWRNICARRIVSGGSTITQQVIKLASRRRGRSWGAKGYEMLAALRLEREWPKEKILEAYLNRCEYGNRFVGVVAAAREYFDKPPGELTPNEAVYLAGLPQAPTRWNPIRRPAAAAKRFSRCVQRLATVDVPHTTQTPAVSWASLPMPALRRPRHRELRAPHFVSALCHRFRALSGNCTTTLDLELQERVELLLRLHLQKHAVHGVGHGAVLVMDHRTGEIRAWCGSGGWTLKEGQFNGVTQYRSCGSTLKPFLYLHALDRRILTAASLLPDTPDAIRAEYIDYDPRNYDERYLGPVRVREALACSLNVPAVFTLSRVGARNAFAAFQQAGLRFRRGMHHYGAGLILGNAEVRMLDLAAAYGAFANGGLLCTPRFLASEPVRSRAISSPAAAQIVASILSDNDARSRAFGFHSALAFPGNPVPCKTGTSSGFRDGWIVGVTARHVVAVWFGNFDGRPMRELAAAAGPAPLWRQIISELLPQDGPVSLTGGEVTKMQVCALTGFLPSAGSPATAEEWFIPGTEPRESSASYFVKRGLGWVPALPPEFSAWTRSPFNHLGAEISHPDALKIVQPRTGSTFIVDDRLPPTQQQIELHALGASPSEVQWTVSGETIPVGADGAYRWQLKRGTHRAVAQTASKRDEIEFQVK